MFPETQSSRSVATPHDHVASLMAWWSLAGVEDAVAEESVDWLRPRPLARPAAAARPAPPEFPARLADFHAWLASAADLTEARWPGRRVLPGGPEEPRLMLVLPAPDSAVAAEPAAATTPEAAAETTPEAATPAPLEPAAMRLIAHMLGAIGLTLDQCYIATLSLVPPPGRQLDPADSEALARRMRHHIGLVKPRALLLLGDQTSRALASTDDMAKEESLLFINQSGGKVPSSSVIHPRLMLGQPSAKAGAWQALRQLVKGWGQ